MLLLPTTEFVEFVMSNHMNDGLGFPCAEQVRPTLESELVTVQLSGQSTKSQIDKKIIRTISYGLLHDSYDNMAKSEVYEICFDFIVSYRIFCRVSLSRNSLK